MNDPKDTYSRTDVGDKWDVDSNVQSSEYSRKLADMMMDYDPDSEEAKAERRYTEEIKKRMHELFEKKVTDE